MDFQELPIYGNEFLICPDGKIWQIENPMVKISKNEVAKYGSENRHKKKKGNNFLSSVFLLLLDL